MLQHVQSKKPNLLVKFSEKFGVDGAKLFDTLKATAFKQRDGSAPTNEQMMALMVVANQYDLNPFTKEIYAFPDKQSGIIPVVGVDGWSRIINNHPNFDGMEFRYSENIITIGESQPCHEWVECVMYRDDRTRPVVAREYLDEVYRPPFKPGLKGPWQTHTKRFLRHKAMIQCSRIAFGFVGIYDDDDSERILEKDITPREVKVSSVDKILPLPQYSDKDLDTNIDKWKELIDSGKYSADHIVKMISSKNTLSEIQINKIKNLESSDIKQD